jgi:hypothetical protein
MNQDRRFLALYPASMTAPRILATRVLAAARAFQIGGPERIRLTRGEAALAKRAGGVALLSASLNLRSKQRLLEALTQATMSTLGSALVVCSERGE